ncbi:MAG: undecaprenyl/decaprenyl-phosphate alpha-N-acetylglucosaminyl 1-phosphate transferase [Phycisphaerales bacterium]|nr:undecaprenyl/decaprenyl-phosphate alpha-N-acetylglucosaminyl 1-phosphate transferase [Phycisphaerales bacterium]
MNDPGSAIASRGTELLAKLQDAGALEALQSAEVLSAVADEQLCDLLQEPAVHLLLQNANFLAVIPNPDVVAYLQTDEFRGKLDAMRSALIFAEQAQSISVFDVLSMAMPVFVIAFLVVLIATPLFRSLAKKLDVVDRPSEARKIHTRVTPYFGGLAILSGLLAGLFYSGMIDDWPAIYRGIPLGVYVGMIAIAAAGLLDDMTNFAWRFKVALILVAAAALAQSDVGTRVAAGLFDWMGLEVLNDLVLPAFPNWSVANLIGAFIIGIFVLGGCNATNLIDGLDGLLSGVTGLVAIGLLALSCVIITTMSAGMTLVEVQYVQETMGTTTVMTLAGVRVVLSLALLGAVLGFLPYNFNPASIFLGDCGSLLLGYMCVVIILMLGEAGETQLMVAGLIIFAIPIIDTLLAIVRRRVQGKHFWDPDAKHMHHILRQRTGSVKKAVLSIYAMGAFFAVLGAGLGILDLLDLIQIRYIYVVFLVLAAVVTWIGWRMGTAEKLEQST